MGVYRAETIKRPTAAVEYAPQQRGSYRQVAGPVTGSTARVIDLAEAGQGRNHLHREHPRAGHDAFNVALRHQKQVVTRESDHLGFEFRPVGQRHHAGAADRQFEPDRFHHQPGHAGDATRYLHRLGDRQKLAAILQIGFPTRAVRLIGSHTSQSDCLPSAASRRCQRVGKDASIWLLAVSTRQPPGSS